MNKTMKVMMLKILKEEHLEEFLNGNIYMNSAGYFKTLDSADIVRSDQYEGLESARQVKELSIKYSTGKWIPIEGIINPLTFYNKESLNFNMFCMYMFSDEIIDEYNKENDKFGDRFVLIRDLEEFIIRFKNSARILGRDCSNGPIEYVSHVTHDGAMGPFRKFDSFSYQNEYRFVIQGGEGKPTILNIGNIRDIVSVGYTADLKEIIRKIKLGEKIYFSSKPLV